MITLPLRMHYSTTALRPPAAWLVPGPGAREWLDELVQWGVPLAAVTLYAVPRSPGDLAPAGVLAIAGDASRPNVSRRCQPYGRIAVQGSPGRTAGGSIFLPVEARIEPAATEFELAAVLGPGDGVWMLHPAVGLIRFQQCDARRVADLLRPLAASGTDWGRAVPGVALSHRLLAIEPVSVPSAELILREGRGEIASNPPAVERLPASPEEPSSGRLGEAGRAIQRQLARLVKWIDSRPSAAGRATPGRLGQWARRQLAELDKSLLATRHREILRLLHLLQMDPDQGLRYALPLRADQHRGLAPPGARLMERPADFNLQRLSGGEPADHWNLPAEFHRRLVSMYYELATREIQLGRHRRAAYIYGELLNDLELAASALTAGGHFREAAVLYRERLGRPGEAARCLEQGGLWTEAIGLYEELQEFEKAGDLYAQLEQSDKARAAYGLAAARLREQHDYLSAARILETKLADTGQAAACLEAGWPASRQAARCLDAMFQLLGRHGRHQAAREKVEQLRRQTPLERSVPLVEVLSRFARSYPDRSVQAAAADATRTVAALWLRAVSGDPGLPSVLAAVRQLVPEDRLLGRDCDRFLQLQSLPPEPRSTASKPSPLRRPPAALRLARTFKLPQNIQWQSAVSAGNVFYAAGHNQGRIEIVQGFWDGRLQMLGSGHWPCPPSRRPPLLLACDRRRHPVLLQPLGGPALHWRWFPATDELPFPVQVGTPPWLTDGAVAVQCTDAGQSILLRADDLGLILSSYSLRGQLLGSHRLAWADIWPDGDRRCQLPALQPLPFCLRDNTAYLGVQDTVYLGVQDRLIVWRPPVPAKVVDLGCHLIGLHCSPPFTRPRVAAALEQGAGLHWDDFQEHAEFFAEDMAAPVLQFIDGGGLVAVSYDECRVYRTAEHHQICWETALDHHWGRPVAVLATARKDHFALLSQDGTVAIYQASRR